MPFPTIHAPLGRALAERGYDEPTPVQSAVLRADAAGRDLLVSAQTGSGKTVAYGLTIADELLGQADTLPTAARPVALVVAPTRELALQVQRELAWLYGQAGAHVIACVGGMDPRREQRRLADGAHIVVGTPGRLRDHLERGALDVTAMAAVVLDEADEMLDLGFRKDLEFILEATPRTRRTLLFSATLPRGIVALARRYQRDALRIEVMTGERGHADIDYRAIRIVANEVEHVVINVLRYIEPKGALVFCNTRESVRHLSAALLERGFAAVALSGELSQSERNHALQSLRDGRARVCVATDVAARGIDLPSLELVIHAELPQDAEALQHRSGRTGRAGRKGTSVLLVPPARRARAEQLIAAAGAAPVWSGPPTPDEIRELDQERLLLDPLFAQESSDDDLAMAKSLLASRSAEDIAAAFARLYRSRLPSPEDVFDPGERRPVRDPTATRRAHERGGSASSGESEGDGVWFRLSAGRQQNADPRWLLPMICRRGKVTKQDIGPIRIFDRETKILVLRGAAERFAAAVRRSNDDDIRIEPVVETGGGHRKTGAKPGRFARPTGADIQRGERARRRKG